MTAPPADARRERAALLALLPLLVGIAVFAVSRPWHSVPGVDERTYTEMTLGVADHGAPSTMNGTPAQYNAFPELRARWNVLARGRLYGNYPPLFPYVAAPLYRAGGLRAVVRFNVALMALLALGCFALGRRALGDPWLGVAAAYVTLLTTPIWGMSFHVSSYALAITLITWSAHFAVGALRARGAAGRRAALAAGVLGGLASATHVFTFPMLLALLAVLALAGVDRGGPTPGTAGLRAHVSELWPTAGSLTRAGYALAAVAFVFAPVAWFNRARFGSWNPVSYGPCMWRSCDATGMTVQNISSMLRFAAPALACAAAGAVLVYLVRRAAVARVAALVALVLLVAPESEVHRNAFLILAVACGFLIDSSYIPIRPPYARLSDGLGNFLGPYVLKSVIQGTPALALAPLARRDTAEERHVAALLAAPGVALIALFAMRANMPSESAIGFSFLHFRYAMPAVPLVVVLSLSAARALPWRWAHLALAVSFAAGVGVWLMQSTDDGEYARRVYLLRVTLGLALAAFVLVARARQTPRPWLRRGAAVAAALAYGAGLATTLAVDFRAAYTLRARDDRRLEAVARHLPRRFALVGWAPELDSVLGGLLPGRDVTYADLYESANWANFRRLVDAWHAEARPIFAVFPRGVDVHNPWDDTTWELVDRAEGLVRIRVR